MEEVKEKSMFDIAFENLGEIKLPKEKLEKVV
jgi:hypothetical protein